MSTPEIILFDWDNTLSDTFPALHESYNYILKQYGMEAWDEATSKQRIRKVGHETFPGIFGDMWEKALEEYRAYYYEHHASSPLFDGVQELFELLKRKGIKIGVISNKLHDPLTIGVEKSGLGPYLSVVMGAEPHRKGKPAPDAMIEALQRLEYKGKLEDVWYVGDTDVDMEFAENAGVKGVFLEHAGLDTRDEILTRFTPHAAHLTLREFLASLD